VERVIAEKLTGFQLTNKFLYCMEPELSLPYIILKNKINILRSLKSGKIDFKNFNVNLKVYFNFNYNYSHICKLLPGDQMEKTEMGRACSMYGRVAPCTGVWWGNLGERDHTGGPRHRWEDNIKMDFQEVGCGGMDWIELA
jgi:hypothetical protein